MGKLLDKKKQKEDALLEAAYQLFLKDGIEGTSISDITHHAGIAKGTFYLYFVDKDDIKNRLITRVTRTLFQSAFRDLAHAKKTSVEERLVYLIDHVIEQLRHKTMVLRFIEKNLSWGMFKQALSEEGNLIEQFHREIFVETPIYPEADTMFFLVLELTSAVCFSTILHNDPLRFEDVQPSLYASIKAIVQTFAQKS